jgi:glycosyltransferase involved in cell wall biosynthesis
VFHTQVTSLFSTDLMQRYPSVISLDATPINYDSVGEAYGHAAASSSFLDQQKYALNRRAFRAAHTLVAWSEWARRSLVDDYGVAPEAIHVLAPGAHRRYFELGQQRAARPRRPGPTRLLFVGGDFVRKGGPSLIEVARDLPDCEVHIVTKAAIDPQGAPNVYVHLGIGPNSPALFALFEAADVFVLPTRAECLAVVLMEAAAAGLPVVTTDVGALAEAVEPGRSGYLLSADNPHPLRTAIEALIADPGKRMRMGQAGLALARRKFDAARNNLTYLQLVRQAADTGRALARTA